MINADIIEQSNAAARAKLKADYDALGAHLDRRGISIEMIKSKVTSYGIAVQAGAWAPAARVLPASPALASRATFLTSSTIAASSIN